MTTSIYGMESLYVRKSYLIGMRYSDKESAIVRNFKDKDIDPPSMSEFSILTKNDNNRMKRKIFRVTFRQG